MDTKVYGRNKDSIASVRLGETEVNLPAAASSPCSHPAQSLAPLDLIPDACYCKECGAFFVHINLRQATLLGIPEGWTRMDARLLQAEIYLAFRPYIRLIQDVQRGMGALPFEQLDAWVDFAPTVYDAIKLLEKGE